MSAKQRQGKRDLLLPIITAFLSLAAIFFVLPAAAGQGKAAATVDTVSAETIPSKQTDNPKVENNDGTRGPFVSRAIYPATRHMVDVPQAHPPSQAAEILQGELPDSSVIDDLLPEDSGSIPQAASQITTLSPINDFVGLDFAHYGTGWPPDPNGDVGPNHYLQSINNGLGIYDKSGTLLKAATLNDFFDGTDTPCDAYSKGDPIVLYDALADRWLITDMSWVHDTGPFYQCIALSASGDPLGDWYQYGYLVSYARWNDYSKMGVWDDGYYMTTNMFQYFDAVELNTRVFAFDRTSMLAGGPLRTIYFDLVDYTSSNYYISLLPANLRGALPPAGSPEYFVAIKDNANTGPLRIWEFEADWETPTNSTFTGPTNVSVPFFATTLNCGGDSGRECIPQPDTTKGLHSIDNKLLMQLQYRNFGDYESLWVNHTVDADSSRDLAGVRWYELRDPGGTPVLHQSGTQGGFVGDLTERWMGSLAVDGQGNMAVGYSASSNTVYPSVRYAGRLKNDTLGTLQQEITMTLGTGSQDTTHRWGDYSAMTIDPVDDCTFWYTNEYYTETNPIISNWQTRIGSFKFDECTTNDLTGTVYDSGTLAGIEGARVEVTHQASNLVQTRPSHTSGSYQFPVAAGTYSVTAMAYGYQPNTVSGAVSGATVIDVPLNPATFYNFSGTVTDAVSGYPIEARIFVIGDTVNPTAPNNETWSAALNGDYALTLAAHIGYTFLVEAEGYLPQQLNFGELTSNTTQNFTLEPDKITCNAPGYEFIGLREDFETWPPPGWTIGGLDVNGTFSLLWDWNGGDGGYGGYLDGNYTGGSGFAATVNSDRNDGIPFKTWLRPPMIDLSTFPTTTLTYQLNYQDGDNATTLRDHLDVSIRINGGAWVDLQTFLTDKGQLYNAIGTSQTLDLSAYAAETQVELSWYYNTDRWTPHNWYAQVDQVRLGVCQAVPDAVVMEPETVTSGASCAPETYHLSFFNHSGSAETANITYTADPAITVTAIPTTLGVIPDGGSASFDVTVNTNGCVAAGSSASVTVTAALAGAPAYTDSTVIERRAVTVEWEQRTGVFKPRSDAGVIATDNYIYQIAGTSSTRSDKSARYVYRYDPAADTWLTMATVVTPVRRIDGAAINNKIYILGGLAYDTAEYTDPYVQIYDEASDTWSSGAGAAFSRSAYAAVAVGDDIYRIGGKPRLSGAKTTVEVYNTLTDVWNSPTDPADYPWEVLWPCAGEIGGKIYAAGGISTTARANSAVYDPVLDSWNDGGMADLPLTLYGAADFVLNGKLYCAGGVQAGAVSAAVWAYDPVADSWSRESDLSEARYRLEGDVLDGAGYVEDGWDPNYSYSTAAFERTTAPQACLAIHKMADPAIAAPGDPVTYTLTFTNTGGVLASGVVITDTIPAAVTGTSFSSSGVGVVQQPATRYVWDVADMACGVSGTITVNGVLSNSLPAGVITNTVEINSALILDKDQVDNLDSAEIAINLVPTAIAHQSGSARSAVGLSIGIGLLTLVGLGVARRLLRRKQM